MWQLPSHQRESNLKRLYQLDVDGHSLLTFYAKCHRKETTFLIIRDSHGYVFGGLCFAPWKRDKEFYGTDQTCLFTFKDGEDIEAFYFNGIKEGDRFQYGA